MDLQTLSNLFATTLSPNPNVQKAGELEIRKVSFESSERPRFVVSLHCDLLVVHDIDRQSGGHDRSFSTDYCL